MGSWAPFRIVLGVVPESAVELCKVSDRGGRREMIECQLPRAGESKARQSSRCFGVRMNHRGKPVLSKHHGDESGKW